MRLPRRFGPQGVRLHSLRAVLAFYGQGTDAGASFRIPKRTPPTPLPTHRRKRNCRMEKRELVIIGAGPTGLSAAIYGKRAGLDTLVLEKGRPGGQASDHE